ncbi:MAG: polysaccharide deacetylase family protein, partial [Alphaproteobacteria bacterium]|nr:polysaccharide deacetylase family protein [Alphaproteobacteria bacterium]
MTDVTTGLLKAALQTMYYTRLDAVLAPVTGGNGVIFMLHHVVPDEPATFAPNRILSITPDFLERVVRRVIAQGFDIVSIDEAWQRMSVARPAGRRFAVFTFDDGYRDNIVHALPVLRRHDAPMTIYVAPDFCDGTGQAWWLTLEDVLASGQSITVPFSDGARTLPLETVAQKYTAHREIYPWLRAMPDVSIQRHVNRWATAAGLDPLGPCRRLVMNWDEVRSVSRDPLVTIGAHTMSHASLAKCSADEARWQVEASIEHIEHQLGIDCRHFAYPYGDAASAGPREFAIARDLGLRTAVTTRKGMIFADAGARMTGLPRLSLNGDYQDERVFKVLLSGAPFKM